MTEKRYSVWTNNNVVATYEQGVEYGIRQERERVRSKLKEIRNDPNQLRWMKPLIDEIEAHIGLGADTTEENEK